MSGLGWDRRLVSEQMRILHVGWGFSPWRPGGLIFYAEDLMAAQVVRGHDVGYFFSGRHYPRRPEPRLKRWKRGGVAMHEIVNGPIVPGMEHGTRHPQRDLSESWMEGAFERTLRGFRPEVVHIQELLGLPSSVIDVAGAQGVPVLMTLQDYFPLCATLRLFDADGRICTRLEVGQDCVLRNVDAPSGPEALIAQTLEYERGRLRRRLPAPVVAGLRAARRLTRAGHGGDRAGPSVAESPPQPASELAEAFQRRRDVNVERLNRVDRLIAQSPRVAEIYSARGVRPDRMQSLPFTLAHVERLRPRSIASPPPPLTFFTSNGCASRTKGVDVVLGALRALREARLEGAFRLRVHGFVDAGARPELERFAGVELRGHYERDEIDAVLDDVDVGIMPSVWEEAFGYVGVEMLAKGIPLIANPLGGIVEYAREGETAWLNDSCSGEGLAEIMSRLSDAPELVVDMHRRVLAARDELVLPMRDHVDAIEAVYGELVQRDAS
jgi:glycosyltransferase involved in cell wall biosynthesis